MAYVSHRRKVISEEEYLKLEDKSVDERHEYIDGFLRLMAGGTKAHNVLIQNFVLKLAMLARTKTCELYTENVRVKLPIGSKKRYYYPDVILTCQPNDGDGHTVENPCFVVEILSKSTSSIDKGEKLDLISELLLLNNMSSLTKYSAKLRSTQDMIMFGFIKCSRRA